jgi:hypothetical protein
MRARRPSASIVGTMRQRTDRQPSPAPTEPPRALRWTSAADRASRDAARVERRRHLDAVAAAVARARTLRHRR